jgi:hypothetical protein
MAQERRINLRFSPEMFDQIDEKRFKLRTSFQQIGVRLFEEWVTGQRPEPKLPPPPKSHPLTEKLETVLASGDAGLIGIVRKAVDASYGLLQHSLTAEEIQHLKAAAHRDSAVAGRDRDTGGTVEGLPGAGKKGTRRSA